MAGTAASGIGQLAFREGVLLPLDDPRPPDLRVAWASEPTASDLEELRRRAGAAAPLLTAAKPRHPRAKIDRLAGARFVSLLPARYVDAEERVEFGELQILVAEDDVILVERGGCFTLEPFVASLTGRAQTLERGPGAVAYAAISAVLDGYEPVLAGLENDIDEIEDEVFAADHDPVRRIYELIREVLTFQRATDPLTEVLTALGRHPDASETARRHSHELQARAEHTSERVAGFRALLENALNVNLALETKRLTEVSIEQTEQTKKISSWAAILFTPSLVAGVYGMNFRHMPELHWALGYPFAIVLMLVMMGGLYAIFKARDWL